ncbi:MAG: hypothetical protein LBB38_02690 [Puniceicoccales bacterium]|jgi:hypothetical protein|nr:hypothetical protein [Puniceicoccales bacterium]
MIASDVGDVVDFARFARVHGSDPEVAAVVSAISACGDIETKMLLESDLRAIGRSHFDRKLHELAINSTSTEIRAVAPQIQLLSLFEGEDQSEPVSVLARLVGAFSSTERLNPLSRADDNFLFLLVGRLMSFPNIGEYISPGALGFVLSFCIDRWLGLGTSLRS